MSKVWVTSDLHFGHKNIAKYCPSTRGHFSDVDHMNKSIVEQWNSVVSTMDTVYIIGDFAFMKPVDAISTVYALNGEKILIEGNHDTKLLETSEFREAFVEVHKYLEIEHNKNKIVMFHYPIYDHNQAARGSIMLHGHKHGTPTGIPGRIKDVGFDATGKVVSLLDDIIEEMLKITPMSHH